MSHFYGFQESIAYFPLVILASGVFSSLGAKQLDKILGAKVIDPLLQAKIFILMLEGDGGGCGERGIKKRTVWSHFAIA